MMKPIESVLQTRRDFLAVISTGAAILRGTKCFGTGRSDGPNILLLGSASNHNIGSMAHVPATLAMLETYLPEVSVSVWPSSSMPSEWWRMVTSRFPAIRPVTGGKGESNSFCSGESAEEAIDRADFILHGSSGGFSSAARLKTAHQRSGKPFGVYGITLASVKPEWTELLDRAAFLFLRDSVSVERMRRSGLKTPEIDFAPDSAFAFDLVNRPFADAFLKQHHLTERKFLCVIPRFRTTPRWLWGKRPMSETERKLDERNERMAEGDHRHVLETMRRILSETDFSILLCPEDQSQMALGRRILYGPLAEAERSRVVLCEHFWRPDEALGVYVRSAGLFGLEMHSPIFCIGHGVPAIVCRFAEQTTKGIMWRDIGLGDWLFDVDDAAAMERLSTAALSFCREPERAGAIASAARNRVAVLLKSRMETLRAALKLPPLSSGPE